MRKPYPGSAASGDKVVAGATWLRWNIPHIVGAQRGNRCIIHTHVWGMREALPPKSFLSQEATAISAVFCPAECVCETAVCGTSLWKGVLLLLVSETSDLGSGLALSPSWGLALGFGRRALLSLCGPLSLVGTRPQEGSFHPPRGPTAAQRLWEEPGLPGQPFPKFQFLLINIISAPVQVNKLTLSDEPAFLPAPNDVILTGSDLCRSLFPGGTEEGWDLTDRGQEAVALTLLFDGFP